MQPKPIHKVHETKYIFVETYATSIVPATWRQRKNKQKGITCIPYIGGASDGQKRVGHVGVYTPMKFHDPTPSILHATWWQRKINKRASLAYRT